MINRITLEQEKQIPKYIKKWVGVASRPMNHKKAIEYTRKLYKSMNQEESIIIFGVSPLHTILLCELFFRMIKEDKDLLNKISQLYSQLYSRLDAINNNLIKSINSTWYLGVGWLTWCGWYEYGKSIGIEFDNDKYDLFVNFNSEVNFIIPYKGICFISEKPVEINWNNSRLHKDGGLAVKYSDGYGLYCLNGVKVDKYLAETPEGELDIEYFKKEKNADVKAEFIRKFGIERMQSLGDKICDAKKNSNEWFRKSEYELINMGKIFGIDYAPHLRMKNLTTGTWHFEAVSPDCHTIEDALKFRAKNRIIQLEGVK